MNTARNVTLQVGALVALYASLSSLIALVFGIINVLLPDTAQYYGDSTGGMRFAIAALIVAFPTYLILTRLVHQWARGSADAVYAALTRWMIYISLLVGSAIFLGDLVAIIFTYLNGEITARFLLKALALVVIIGSALTYYFFDVRGYWSTHERQSIIAGIIAGIVVLVSLGAGFALIESPQEIRQQNIDQTQIQDVYDMTATVEGHYRLHDRLPQSLSEAYGEIPVPQAPEDREAYSYRILDETRGTYELCATFAQASDSYSQARAIAPRFDPYMSTEHTAGRYCFTRRIPTQLLD